MSAIDRHPRTRTYTHTHAHTHTHIHIHTHTHTHTYIHTYTHSHTNARTHTYTYEGVGVYARDRSKVSMLGCTLKNNDHAVGFDDAVTVHLIHTCTSVCMWVYVYKSKVHRHI